MRTKKTLQELRIWNQERFWGAAGYDGSKDYHNGKYTGEGERAFLQERYDESLKIKESTL